MPTSRRKATSSKPAADRETVAGAAADRARTGSAADQIVLAGPPGRLHATVSVENAVSERVSVRGAVLHRSGRDPVAGTATALISPGATASVPVSVSLDRTTPPGEVAAELELGGTRRPVRVLVEPELDLHLSPHRVLATVGRQRVPLTLVNHGNVDIPLAPLSRARTDDGGPDPGPDISLTVLDPTTVEPGAIVSVAAELTVPEELDPTRRHVARIPVGTADLEVVVLPRTAPEEPS
ncbi:hypothetical protein GCM10027517_13150 [Phycicoccus ginsengisoli]